MEAAIRAMRRQLAKEEEARASFAQAMKDGPVTDYHAWQYMRERRGYPPKDSDAAALAACITPKQKWLLQELSELPYPNPWRRAEVPALCWPYAGPFPAHGRAPNHAKGDDLDLLMRALQRGEQVYPFKFPTPVYKGTLTLVTPKCGPSLSAALEANPGVFTCPSMDDSVAVWQTRAETDAKLVTAEFWARETKEVRIPVTRHPMTQAQADKWSSEDTRALAASTGRPVWILVFEDGVIVFSEVYFADPSQFLELPVKVEHCFPAGHFFPDRPPPLERKDAIIHEEPSTQDYDTEPQSESEPQQQRRKSLRTRKRTTEQVPERAPKRTRKSLRTRKRTTEPQSEPAPKRTRKSLRTAKRTRRSLRTRERAA